MKPFPCPIADVRAGSSIQRQAFLAHAVEASSLSEAPHEKHAAALWWAFNLICSSAVCDMDDWCPELCGGKAALSEAMVHWSQTNRKSGPAISSTAATHDMYLWGAAAIMLALHFGDLPPLGQWVADAAAEFNGRELPRTRDFADTASVDVMMARGNAQLLIRLGRPGDAHTILEAIGFGWGDDSFALYDEFQQNYRLHVPGTTEGGDAVFHRLVVFLATPQSTELDAKVCAWMPSAAAIAQHERGSPLCQHWPWLGMLALAAIAFLRLGRPDDAAEAARILVSPEHHCILPSDLAQGHCVLGQVAAMQGHLEEAGDHFARALGTAKASRYPLLEVVAARDWKRAVPGDAAGAADAALDNACVKLGKSREQLALVL
jgi:hypothetical protein